MREPCNSINVPSKGIEGEKEDGIRERKGKKTDAASDAAETQ